MNEEYKVYDGRKWMGWGISATMISRRDRSNLPDDKAKDIIIHHPKGELVIPYGIARVLMSHVHHAFERIDRTYRSQHEYREEQEKEWNDSLTA